MPNSEALTTWRTYIKGEVRVALNRDDTNRASALSKALELTSRIPGDEPNHAFNALTTAIDARARELEVLNEVRIQLKGAINREASPIKQEPFTNLSKERDVVEWLD